MGASANPRIDEIIDDRYIVERPLGEGGMGTVFVARHTMTGRRVALKWVESEDQSLRQRLLREARAIAKVSHRSVVDVLDAGEHRDGVFIVLEYLSGDNLRAHTRGRMLTPTEAVLLLMPALEGVAAAHQAGILHRDLKPENLFVCKDAEGAIFDTKVLDFGVAKHVLGAEEARPRQTALTQAGHIVGTPEYMAPEQISHNPKLDERTDVYAMGIVLYELLAGRLPYETRELKALLLDIIRAEFASPSRYRDDLPDGLCKVVMKAIASAPHARYESIAAFAQALEPWAEGRRFEPPRKLADQQDAHGSDFVTAPTMHQSGSVRVSETKKAAAERATVTRQGHANAHAQAARTVARGPKPAAAQRERANDSRTDVAPISVAAMVTRRESSERPIAEPSRLVWLITGGVLILLAVAAWRLSAPRAQPTHAVAPVEATVPAPPAVVPPAVPATVAPQPASTAAQPAVAVEPATNPITAPANAEPAVDLTRAQPPASASSTSTVSPRVRRRAQAATESTTQPAALEVKTRAGVFGAKDF